MNKCLWLYGLSGAGKSSIACELKKYKDFIHLDGDAMRDTYLGRDVDFSPLGRKHHLLRMGAIAKVLVSQGHDVVCSFISPKREVRDEIAKDLGDKFISVYINSPLEICENRDVKGLYKLARDGKIQNFTGISAPFEPEGFDVEIDTYNRSLENCTKDLLTYFDSNKKYSMFVGRWNGSYHLGHDHIVQSKLDEGQNVLLAVRDVEVDEKNPCTALQVKEMLEYRFKDDNRVKVIIIPDIASIEYGRGVGYEVNEIKVTKQIAGISGTEIRSLMKDNDDSWKKLVPKEIGEFLCR